MADTGKTIGLIKALASVDPEAIKSSVDDWLDDHPEATTTVEDGAITKAKLDSSLQQTVDDVGDLKSAFDKTIAYSENRFNPEDYTNNATVDGSGDIVSATGTWVSGEIKVPDGAEHVILSFLNSQNQKQQVTTSSTRICFYGDLGYIDRSASTSVDLASNTTYIRFIIADSYAKNKVMLEFNATMSDDFVAYKETITPSMITVDGTLTATGIPADAKVTGDKITSLENNVGSLLITENRITQNYFNPDTVTMGKSIDSSGNEQTSTGYCISERINIPETATKAVLSYTATNGTQSLPSSYSRVGAYYYKADGTHLSGGYGAHTIPTGAAYAILTMNSTYSANDARRRVMYEFAESASRFVPYTDITTYTGNTEHNHFNLLAEIVNNAPQIKLIGDSITQGVGGTGFAQDGDLIFSDGVSNTWNVNTSGYCWANLFKTHVEAISDATVKNWGCRGISCMDVLVLDMLPTLIEDDDDIVIVMLGTNDRTDTQVPAENADLMYQMNLKAICDYIIGQGKKLILISPIPATPEGDSVSGVHFDSNTVNMVCTSVANQVGCEYFNLSKELVNWILSTNGSYNTLYSDTLHPSDKGYELMYYLICKGLNIPLDWTFTFEQ